MFLPFLYQPRAALFRSRACALLVFCAAFAGVGLVGEGRGVGTPISPAPVEIVVDGKAFPASATGFRIPASYRSVSFRLGKSAQDDPEGSHRMRFRLDGVDGGWRQMGSEMCLIVRFADAAGDQVAQRIFPVDGISAGWRGDVENSAWSERRETVRVPAGGSLVTVAISSSGPPTAMGIYVVRGLKILRRGSTGMDAVYETPTGRSAPVPQGWTRSGTRPSMAKMVHTDLGEAFCILDDDASAHAEWVLSRAAAPRVEPGELLTVEWSEMYDIGMANRFDINYGRLNAGNYRFWSEELDATGKSFGAAQRLDFVVLEAFWKSPWFWISGLVVAGLLLWFGGQAIIRLRIRQHLARVEQEHMVERERLRIARDLHDDLGARLTHISLLSSLAGNDPQSAPARESFERISGMARELVAALYQTVWTVNPEHDHLEALVNYICQLTQNLCESARIRCRIYSCEVPVDWRVTSEIRHNVTLAVKEAIHNAIKHSGATEIGVRMEFGESRLRIEIHDNGHGFDAVAIVPGNGLGNMRRRMILLGGEFTMESSPATGSTVRFEVPIPATDSKRASTSSAT